MREKTLCLIISFHTTAAAMAMERLCEQRQLPGRLIPIPREITADCGMSWKAPLESRAELVRAANEAGLPLDGIYEILT